MDNYNTFTDKITVYLVLWNELSDYSSEQDCSWQFHETE